MLSGDTETTWRSRQASPDELRIGAGLHLVGNGVDADVVPAHGDPSVGWVGS